MTTGLSDAQRSAVSRISGLVLINAMIFQEILAESDSRVLPLMKVIAATNPVRELYNHWDFIIKNIDFYPIFYVAKEILANLTAPSTADTLTPLAVTAQTITGMKAALRHDLMGRIYHRLLVEAKFLGTYYTSIPAAALLLKLSLRPDAWAIDWHDLNQVGQLNIADLSCGTGTLLMASADTITDNYISAAAAQGINIDVNTLQTALVENILHGYDVLPSAIHLTASTLAMRSPSTAFKNMNLYSLPLGGNDDWLGSIEYLTGDMVQIATDMFGSMPVTKQTTGIGEKEHLKAHVPALDLAVMNPPFTRSVGNNLLFGSVPEAERKRMQKKLGKLLKQTNAKANATAGLGSVFVAVAHHYIKSGGRLSLVLPKALLSGVAWGRTRELIGQKYRVEYIVCSHDPERWNFSESTKLSETLLVAVKTGNGQPSNSKVVAVNLWRNPTTTFEALAIAQSITENNAPDIENEQGALNIFIGDNKVGEAVSLPWDKLNKRIVPTFGQTAKVQVHTSWLIPCAFAQSDLTRAAYHLSQNEVWLPGFGHIKNINLCELGKLGTLGPDRRDIHDCFMASGATVTAYPAFWGHDSKTVLSMSQQPNEYLTPLSKAEKGRHLRQVTDLWPRSGRVLLAERMRLNTDRLVSVRTSDPVLANVWWPFSPNKEDLANEAEKALVMWLNSTPGIIVLLAYRVETEGAWVDFKKPTLIDLPVLNPFALSGKQLQDMVVAYDTLCYQELCPLSEIETDKTRIAIDKAIADALGLSANFSILRKLLAQEPIINLKRL